MSKYLLAALAASSLVAACAAPQPAPAPAPPAAPVAAEAPANPSGLEASGKAAAEACSPVKWSVIRKPTLSATLVGVAWFADMSGQSTVRGTFNQRDGTFSGVATSVSGRGPQGPFSGRTRNGSMEMELNGTGCSAVKMKVVPSLEQNLG